MSNSVFWILFSEYCWMQGEMVQICVKICIMHLQSVQSICLSKQNLPQVSRMPAFNLKTAKKVLLQSTVTDHFQWQIDFWWNSVAVKFSENIKILYNMPFLLFIYIVLNLDGLIFLINKVVKKVKFTILFHHFKAVRITGVNC